MEQQCVLWVIMKEPHLINNSLASAYYNRNTPKQWRTLIQNFTHHLPAVITVPLSPFANGGGDTDCILNPLCIHSPSDK